MRNTVLNAVDGGKSALAVGSPVRTGFSAMMDLNWAKLGRVEKQISPNKARLHLNVAW